MQRSPPTSLGTAKPGGAKCGCIRHYPLSYRLPPFSTLRALLEQDSDDDAWTSRSAARPASDTRVRDDAACVNLQCSACPGSLGELARLIHHGLPTDLYALGSGSGGYLAFIGRICPEKRPDRAIAIARRAGLPLRIAAKVDKVDRAYHEAKIKPMPKDPRVEFIGEIGDHEKRAFYGEAIALLFPIDWPEPFGLVMIEAIANGTPVIAFRRGAVPEIIDDRVIGFIVESVDEAVAAVPWAKALDRPAIRRHFEDRFSVERMTRDYIALYSEIWRHTAVNPILNPIPERRRPAA
jgi:glycosyltransferase involved in cell wall biosynthesis